MGLYRKHSVGKIPIVLTPRFSVSTTDLGSARLCPRSTGHHRGFPPGRGTGRGTGKETGVTEYQYPQKGGVGRAYAEGVVSVSTSRPVTGSRESHEDSGPGEGFGEPVGTGNRGFWSVVLPRLTTLFVVGLALWDPLRPHPRPRTPSLSSKEPDRAPRATSSPSGSLQRGGTEGSSKGYL